MDLSQYVDDLRRELLVAAGAGGDDARELADRLTAPMASAVRLMLLDALSGAAAEITAELAPGSVELRLRSGEPEFVVTLPPADEPLEVSAVALSPDGDDDATARINLRLPEQLKVRVEQAASGERLSVNAWLVRLVASAVARDGGVGRPRQRGGRVGDAYTGWVR